MSKYVAKSNIPFGSALAYTRGQTVDGDAVERNGWQDYVVSANTKEAKQILAEVAGEDLDEEDKPASSSARSERRG